MAPFYEYSGKINFINIIPEGFFFQSSNEFRGDLKLSQGDCYPSQKMKKRPKSD